MMWKVMVAGLVMMVLGGAGEAGEAPVPPFTVGKETTRIVGPLREDGTVDYAGAMNERYGKGVKAEENAFVGWLEVVGTGESGQLKVKDLKKYLAMCGAAESAGMKWVSYQEVLKGHDLTEQRRMELMFDDHDAGGKLWEETEYPLVAEYLKTNEKVLDAVKEAFARKKYFSPVENSAFFSGMGSLAKMRDRCNALAARATLRAKAGDFEGFVSDVMAIKRAAAFLEGGATGVERLMGYALDAKADVTIGLVAGAGILPKGTCAKLWEELSGFKHPAWREWVDVEQRWIALYVVTSVAVGKVEDVLRKENEWPEEQRQKWNRAWESVEAGKVDWDEVLKRVNKAFDERVETLKRSALADLKWHARASTADVDLGRKDGESVNDYSERVATGIIGMMLTAQGDDAEVLWRREMMQHEMAKMVVALAGYRADKGKWPAKLEELVPGYVKELPRDIYSENGKEAVKYEVKEEGVRVYSVGGKMLELGVR